MQGLYWFIKFESNFGRTKRRCDFRVNAGQRAQSLILATSGARRNTWPFCVIISMEFLEQNIVRLKSSDEIQPRWRWQRGHIVGTRCTVLQTPLHDAVKISLVQVKHVLEGRINRSVKKSDKIISVKTNLIKVVHFIRVLVIVIDTHAWVLFLGHISS